MRKVLLMLTSLFLNIVCFAQVREIEVFVKPELQGRGELPYSDTPLEWSNFCGKPDRKSFHAAMTYSGIRISYEVSKKFGKVAYKVFLSPYMDQQLSWYKPEGVSAALLEHEQRHFDLTAIVAEELANEIRAAEFQVASFARDLKKIHEKHLAKLKVMQQHYDDDTHHGLLPARQQAWNKHLSEILHRFVWMRQ